MLFLNIQTIMNHSNQSKIAFNTVIKNFWKKFVYFVIKVIIQLRSVLFIIPSLVKNYFLQNLAYPNPSRKERKFYFSIRRRNIKRFKVKMKIIL